jgi:prolyl-tRNA editing enzyme YbaK/EbsC (Cys-tRNA(Pro) deacylase)
MPTSEPEPIRRLRALLDAADVDYAVIVHEAAVVSAEDGVEEGFGDLPEMAPALILKTKQDFIAAIIGGERRISYKKVKKALGLRDVSLAAPEQVRQITGAEPGAISLVNPGLRSIMDRGLLEQERVYGGTGLAGYTLHIRSQDLVMITGAQVFDFTEEKA